MHPALPAVSRSETGMEEASGSRRPARHGCRTLARARDPDLPAQA